MDSPGHFRLGWQRVTPSIRTNETDPWQRDWGGWSVRWGARVGIYSPAALAPDTEQTQDYQTSIRIYLNSQTLCYFTGKERPRWWMTERLRNGCWTSPVKEPDAKLLISLKHPWFRQRCHLRHGAASPVYLTSNQQLALSTYCDLLSCQELRMRSSTQPSYLSADARRWLEIRT